MPCSYTATTQCVGKEKGSFKASKGWFRSFKNVMSLNSMKTVESASADHVAAGKYRGCLKQNGGEGPLTMSCLNLSDAGLF